MRRLAMLVCIGLTGCATAADCGPDWFAVEEGYQQGFAQRPRPVV